MRRVIRILCALLLSAAPLWAQEPDPFDEVDSMLDAHFAGAEDLINARYEAVHLAVDRAFKGLTRKIEVSWGEDARLPSREEWVTYSSDMDSRMTMDFSAGEVVFETVLPEGADMPAELRKLAKFAHSLLEANAAELDQQDSLVQAINVELQQSGTELDPADAEAVMAQDAVEDSVLQLVLPVAEINEALEETQQHSLGDAAVVESGGVKKLQLRHTFVSNAQALLIEAHLDTIRQYADVYAVPVSVVLAIIETESSFNPRAVSPVPAFGLMQLVPRTAGVDAYQRVHGEKRVVSAEYLFDENHNIQLGTAYLGLVRDGYLRAIENPYSRFYCAVAAYNTGVGNVAKTFAGTTSLKSAARRINQMSEQEVYAYLIAELPAEETRNYLRKIITRVENYKHLDTGQQI